VDIGLEVGNADTRNGLSAGEVVCCHDGGLHDGAEVSEEGKDS